MSSSSRSVAASLTITSLLAAVAGLACSGEVNGGAGKAASSAPPPSMTPPGGAMTPAPGAGGITPPGSAGPAPAPAAATARFYRLSHQQWQNTVRDLLGVPAPAQLTAGFAKDALDSFSNDGEALAVADQLRIDYQRAAETLAAGVTNDPAALARLVPAPTGDGTARAEAFIRGFGLRAHRRPLDAGEVAEYLALFRQGATLDAKADPFAAGVRLVIEALLQSPFFLYRTELVAGRDRVRLDDHEIASKLSYALGATMPDAALFAAAAGGRLRTREGVAAEAKRLLEAGGAGPSTGFHGELFALNDYDQIEKETAHVPAWKPALARSLRREADAFLGEVFQTGRGLTELLTAPFTFVDAELAPLYGLPAPSAGLARVDLDPKERAGFLTHLGFLAAFASSTDPDPIHRGAFINERILCVELPPPNITVFPEPPPGLRTNRERIEALTGKGTCGETCHGRWMNPAGFAFEHYDVLGRYRATDNGQPVNAADTFPFSDKPRSYSNAIEFSRALAESPDAHRCYAKNWLAYLQSRSLRPEDAPLVDWLAGASARGLSLRELVVTVVTNDSFLMRLP